MPSKEFIYYCLSKTNLGQFLDLTATPKGIYFLEMLTVDYRNTGLRYKNEKENVGHFKSRNKTFSST